MVTSLLEDLPLSGTREKALLGWCQQLLAMFAPGAWSRLQCFATFVTGLLAFSAHMYSMDALAGDWWEE